MNCASRAGKGGRAGIVGAGFLALAVWAAGTFGVLGQDTATGGLSRAEVFRQTRELSAIGRRMFSDSSLSASGRMSCASCHDPGHAFAPANGLAVQLGGEDLQRPGLRAVPSLTYNQVTPQFTQHFHESEDESDESVDAGPTGGLTWDGRVDRLRNQALIPLMSPVEMANSSLADLTARVDARYGRELRAALGPSMPNGDGDVLHAGLLALEAFQQSEADFYPYSSKYDAYLAGRANLTPQEMRGLAAFEDEGRGNCASCHPSRRGGDGSPPQFTDYGIVAVAAPRNSDIPANSDPAFFDLGLCGPVRTDFSDRPDYCGRFKTPTLRNVALRRAFFHNGVFHALRQAVAFYAWRDLDPGRFYARDGDGRVVRFDDLPKQYHCNINFDPPFDRVPGDAPALSEQDIDDIVAFLGTLTDGYRAAPETKAETVAMSKGPTPYVPSAAARQQAEAREAVCGKR